ncbi:MAG: YchF/TatD family DNA exonuclease [Deltaproteobacteria bacterium]|nr:YchF/TatD family DNA exonuclease [Deltaproteobacteria bacterium]MCL5277376.1 YchF/TatD family DNA exonuclease [Deltaproteobacteria bacterium]
MIRLYDSHAHLNFQDYDKDREDVIGRALDAGAEFIINIGSGMGMKGNYDTIGIANTHEKIYATVGLHPHEASLFSGETLEEIEGLADNPKVVAIGEVGLDYHYMHSPRDEQIKAFRAFIGLARRRRLPLVIHSRDANREVMDILREQRAGDVAGVIHSYGGDREQARGAIDLGFYLSINGIVTFKNAQALRDAVSELPVERLLIETDCPFLSPVPHRGKRNEPAYTAHVLSAIARIKHIEEGRLSEILLDNAGKAFGIGVGRTIAYVLRNNLYLNITNKCTNACVFCPKFGNDYYVTNYNLRLFKTEPSYDEIVGAVKDPSAYDEIVFVGFGEPTQRLDMLLQTARWLKEHGARLVRLDTDGLGNLVYGRDITPELAKYIDAVSVSLNAPDAQTYARLCPNPYGAASYRAVVEFIRAARQRFRDVTATMVSLPNIDVEKTRAVARGLGVDLRVRLYYRKSLRDKTGSE